MTSNIARARTRTRAVNRVLRTVEMVDGPAGDHLLQLTAEDTEPLAE
jgi:hypothetical protein